MAFAAQSAVAIENARLYGQVLQERDRILTVESAIRNELARDLHDGPAQMLSVLIMHLRLLKELAQRDPELVFGELVNLEAEAQKAMYQTRNILFDLRPVILEQRGLAAALEQYAIRLRMTERLRVTLNMETLKSRLDWKREGAVFSIVQEAVNNVKKHANANLLEIRASEDEEFLTIQVKDDGTGFDLYETQAHSGERGSYGLLNMKERAEIAKGKLVIESTPTSGTTVTLQVPINPARKKPDTM
jgi:signal transduction histidine kinase